MVATVYVDTGLTISGLDTSEIIDPWVALPYETMGLDWQLYDLIYMRFENGKSLMARALDAGPFYYHCVETADGCLPIMADVPAEHWQHGQATSARLSYFANITEDARKH